MKFLHLADLHLGKSLHNLSLMESGDQPFWVERLLELTAREKPDAVLIAGDVYDRGVPSREAVQLLSHLLTELSAQGVEVLLTAGNHDGGERLEFASSLLSRQRVHIAGTVQREMTHVMLHDELGPVHFWLMPYVFPAAVRAALALEEDKITGYSAAVQALLEAQHIDYTQRNVLLAHQTVIADGVEAEHSASETSVGGVGGIDAALLKQFDYVALGHIHGAQKVGWEHIRYAGAPLCYHFSEANQRKGPMMVTLGAKDAAPKYELLTIPPLHRVRPTMTGTLAEVQEWEQNSTSRDEYVRVELTDDWLPQDTHETLRTLFQSHGCRLLDLARVPRQLRSREESDEAAVEVSLEEHFLRFYRRQTGKDDPERRDAELIRLLAEQIGDRPDRTEDELTNDLVDAVLKQEVDAK